MAAAGSRAHATPKAPPPARAPSRLCNLLGYFDGGSTGDAEIPFIQAANVHCDTSLRYATFTGVDQPYTVTEWRELTDPAERTVLP